MVTHKTLEVYLAKVKKMQSDVETAVSDMQKQLAVYDKTQIALQAQIETLEQLMDYDNNQPEVEVPLLGDDIEEMHDNRLEGPEGLSRAETKQERQEVYLGEAMNNARSIDAANTGTDAERDTEGSGASWSVSGAG